MWVIIQYPAVSRVRSSGKPEVVYFPPQACRVGLAKSETAAALAAAEAEAKEFDPETRDTFAIAKVIRVFPSEGFGNFADVLLAEEGREIEVQYPFEEVTC